VLKTLDRYIIRDIVPPLMLSLLIFTFILCIPPVMEQLEALVAKGVPWGTAATMLLMLIPQALGLTIPMALLVGLLIGLGRLSGDRETVALLACGVSPYRLLRPVLLVAGIAGAAHLYVMIKAIPDANQTFRQITYDVVSQRRCSSRTSRDGSSTRATSRRPAPGGKTSSSPTRARPIQPSCSWRAAAG
jgi:lipopolysaccharide export system permease protein